MSEGTIKFNLAVIDSMPDVLAVAASFIRKGHYDVMIPEMNFWAEYREGSADLGDLFVTNVLTGQRTAIEVKGHTDTPFETLWGYKDIFLDKVSIYQRKIARGYTPDWYYVLGECRRKAAVFDVTKWKACARETCQKDKRTEEMVKVYRVPKDQCLRVSLI